MQDNDSNKTNIGWVDETVSTSTKPYWISHKNCSTKTDFLEEHYLRVQSPYLLNGYWFLLMRFPGENLSRIFEDLHKDSSADLWGFLSKILKDLPRFCQDSQGSGEDLQGSLKVFADICKILKDLGKILKVLIGKILRDLCAITADLCTILKDLWNILKNLCKILSDVCTILTDLCHTLTNLSKIFADLCTILTDREQLYLLHRNFN